MNGTGKSTISKFLYDLDRFPSCNFNIDGSFSPTVYNQSFIDDNFVNSSMQEGVFTLSKDNADLEARVVEKSKLREKLLAIYNKIKSDISLAKQAQDDALKSAIDEVFKQKHVIEKSSLEPFLKSFKTPKRKFYEQVERQKGENSQSINDLDIEYQSLNQFDKNLPKAIILPAPPELSLEDIIVLSEPIVGSTNSQLCDFIAKLDNLYWVKSGKEEYLKEHQTKCPFCQKETIDESFRSELSALFDKTYEHGVEKVQAIESSYCQNFTRYIDSIKTEFTNCSMYDQEQHDVDPLIELLERAYRDNLDLIKSKVKSPSLGIELNDCSDKLNPINKLADEINKLVDSVALKIKKFEENEKDIRNRMWDSLRYHTDGIFSLKQRIVEEKSSEIRLLENKLERVKQIGLKVANRISTLRSKTSNIDDTIDRINESLKSLGITGFEIIASREQEQKNYFVLSRGCSGQLILATVLESWYLTSDSFGAKPAL
ncbi:AAA family ATPase [Pseudoalteromonas sp. GCY]|uniref:AAA family ATPase n=1 Tax=Pseudoalteromonas sp. GCY TaxID=2003316 RepID=UPI001916CDE5|nr:AAA family ATPase [Pseudoalteromonas sp. GCY]QQQ66876.1 AAA family ATPase [Pseudoalteromonas sp. GCY]